MHSKRMFSMINIDFLQYLTEYSKIENLTKASKSLHISQSALTRAMQKIEDYIGVPIFDRTKNKLTLNSTGLELVKNAKLVLEAEKLMKERTLAFYNSTANINIGIIAYGPMIKYGNLLYSAFPNKTILSKIEEQDVLVDKLLDNYYDVIFTSTNIENDLLVSKYVFTESLYISLPKNHFLAGLQQGVHFSEIDGQSFLVSENLGVWDKIVDKHLPKSKFFPQALDNLYEIVNASTIPSFATNITIPIWNERDRVNIPILDEDAKVDFYLVYKKEKADKLKAFFKLLFR